MDQDVFKVKIYPIDPLSNLYDQLDYTYSDPHLLTVNQHQIVVYYNEDAKSTDFYFLELQRTLLQVKTARRLLYADLGRTEEDSTKVFIFDSRSTVFGFNIDLTQILLSE